MLVSLEAFVFGLRLKGRSGRIMRRRGGRGQAPSPPPPPPLAPGKRLPSCLPHEGRGTSACASPPLFLRAPLSLALRRAPQDAPLMSLSPSPAPSVLQFPQPRLG